MKSGHVKQKLKVLVLIVITVVPVVVVEPVLTTAAAGVCSFFCT